MSPSSWLRFQQAIDRLTPAQADRLIAWIEAFADNPISTPVEPRPRRGASSLSEAYAEEPRP
jgi:hypothetical protein